MKNPDSVVVTGVTKNFGAHRALDSVSFVIQPRCVTALLGPNGSGKTTLLRIALGLENASVGKITVLGFKYKELSAPVRRVGAHLDSMAAHPGRNAFNHLWAIAVTHGIPRARIAEVLEAVGLSHVARQNVGGFSLGMKQRLGIAGALLGDPDIYIFDEPTNGLDVEGIRWFRKLVRDLVAAGKTIIFSSHILGEVEQIADQIIVLGRGRVLFDGPLLELAPFREGLEGAYSELVANSIEFASGNQA